MKKKILIVEDDPHIRLGVCDALSAEGYEVVELPAGNKVLVTVRERKPDLILLDLMLPGKNGYDVCRELRQEEIRTPIIMLTAKGQEIDKVLGLELGADDYVTKPFGLRELLARIQAVLRRGGTSEKVAAEEKVPREIVFGDLRLEPATLRGTRGAVPFELTPRECKVLLYLYARAGEAVSRDDLLNRVWGTDYYGTTRTLDQVIVKLRQKLEKKPSEPRHLVTVHGLGYRLQLS
ncbi:MAG: response regulator transcription factor [Blastochloris sp.]|nr:response regulator transcription factor [Blastochloris sp.]